MIDDNGSCPLIEQPVLHVTGARVQRRAASASLHVCKFREGSHVRTVMRERLLFQSLAKHDGAILQVIARRIGEYFV